MEAKHAVPQNRRQIKEFMAPTPVFYPLTSGAIPVVHEMTFPAVVDGNLLPTEGIQKADK